MQSGFNIQEAFDVQARLPEIGVLESKLATVSNDHSQLHKELSESKTQAAADRQTLEAALSEAQKEVLYSPSAYTMPGCLNIQFLVAACFLL